MAAAPPTRLVPAQLMTDLHATLARLRTARIVDPSHDQRLKAECLRKPGTIHVNCDTCTAEKRLNWLIEQLTADEK